MKPPSTLQEHSVGTLTRIILDLFRRLEENPQDRDVRNAQDYFKTLPTMIIHQLLNGSIERYIQDCKDIALNNEGTNLVSAIQNGLHTIERKCLIPRLGTVYSLLVFSNVSHLDFTNLIRLGTLSSGAFNTFHIILAECLRRVPKLQHLNLRSPNSRTSLPSVTGDHLKILGRNCPNLRFLDISFNSGLRSEDLLNLVPEAEVCAGCPALEILYLYDCGFSDKIVKVLASKLTNLSALGFNEMGSVLKRLHKENLERNCDRTLKLTHINHLGSKKRKTSLSSLRCKKIIIEAIQALCPQLTNLKARVQDADVEHLANLKYLDSVELLFNVGRPTSPALGSTAFFQIQGANLTSVALICSAISMVHIGTLGKHCPNLCSLWLRLNHFQVAKGCRDDLPEDFSSNHNYFTSLRTLYFRVGENELALSFVPHYVLPYILRNTGSTLRVLKLALRSYIINDEYICSLLTDCNLFHLENLLIVVPGQNNFAGVLSLTMQTVDFVLANCPGLKTLGNVLSWDVTKSDEFMILQSQLKEDNSDLDLVCRYMVMH